MLLILLFIINVKFKNMNIILFLNSFVCLFAGPVCVQILTILILSGSEFTALPRKCLTHAACAT